jgi:hypothetical protein
MRASDSPEAQPRAAFSKIFIFRYSFSAMGVGIKTLSGYLIAFVFSLLHRVNVHQVLENPQMERLGVHKGRVWTIIELIGPDKIAQILQPLYVDNNPSTA